MLIRNWGLIRNQAVLLLTVDSFYRSESSYHQSVSWKFFWLFFFFPSLTLCISKIFPLEVNRLHTPVSQKPRPSEQGGISCVGCDADLPTVIRCTWTFNPARVTFDGQRSHCQTLQPESAMTPWERSSLRNRLRAIPGGPPPPLHPPTQCK